MDKRHFLAVLFFGAAYACYTRDPTPRYLDRLDDCVRDFNHARNNLRYAIETYDSFPNEWKDDEDFPYRLGVDTEVKTELRLIKKRLDQRLIELNNTACAIKIARELVNNPQMKSTTKDKLVTEFYQLLEIVLNGKTSKSSNVFGATLTDLETATTKLSDAARKDYMEHVGVFASNHSLPIRPPDITPIRLPLVQPTAP